MEGYKRGPEEGTYNLGVKNAELLKTDEDRFYDALNELINAHDKVIETLTIVNGKYQITLEKQVDFPESVISPGQAWTNLRQAVLEERGSLQFSINYRGGCFLCTLQKNQ